MNGWKYIAGAGIVGFVLSLISGFVSGNPLGVVVLRSFLSAVVLAGLAFGVSFVIKRYFPELESIVEGNDKTEEKESGSVGGEEVDIVIPEENPHSNVESEEIEEVEILDDEGKEMDEEIKSGNAGEDAENVNNEDKDSKVEPDVVGEAVDNLPDLDGLQLDGGEKETKNDASGTSRNATVTSDVLGTEVDPTTLAKAVRSFMKKDEEG